MKKIITLVLSLAVIFVLIKCNSGKRSTWPGYDGFPDGYGYMDTADLQKAYNAADVPYLRRHGWSMFAGIMQPAANGSGWPLWYTWPNSVDAMQIKQIYGQQENGLAATAPSAVLQRMNNSLIGQNRLNLTDTILDTLQTPYYPMPAQVVKAYAGQHVFTNASNSNIIPGKHFLFNGDIMIPSESLSEEGYDWIHDNGFFNSNILSQMNKQKVPNLNAPPRYIVTKHMFWPVLANQLNMVPVWEENYFNPSYAGYAGYEKWDRFVAIDPSNKGGKSSGPLGYLYGVYNWDTTALLGPVSRPSMPVHNINEFYYHQVTQADWNAFDASDKAILNASSYWAYNKPFGVGDYLVTIAMHVNTKELDTWTMQSVWWTDLQNQGQYSKDRPDLSAVTKDTTWRHYNMVEAYGIPEPSGQLPVGMNPYIELVIHPIATNCNNCHMQAGYPKASQSDPSTANFASYQNPECKGLLQKLTANSPCLSNYMRTDFQWIISDYAHPLLLDNKKTAPGKK